MFIENLEYIRQTEEKARALLVQAHQDGKVLARKSRETGLQMEKTMKADLQAYAEKKNQDAEAGSERRITELKAKNEELKKEIKNKALKKMEEAARFIYEELLRI